jgi:hypothetical protein
MGNVQTKTASYLKLAKLCCLQAQQRRSLQHMRRSCMLLKRQGHQQPASQACRSLLLQ